MNGTNYNSPCSFAEEIVGYIYDEITVETKAKFETHLAKCNSCADELADFGIVRSQVSDWKLKEFSSLETPQIELPLVQTVENTQVKRRWFDSLRNLVMLSPAWTTQAAAFATLAICFGFTFYLFSKKEAIIDVPPPNTVAKSSPNILPTPPVNTTPTPKVDVEIAEQNPPKSSGRVIKTVMPATSKKVVVPAMQTDTKTVAPKAKPNRNKKPVSVPKQSDVNLVSDDEDEDNSLRLSDLFDEISMK